MSEWMRPAGRPNQALRPLSIELNPQKHTAGSVIIRWGDTHVLCSASVEARTPHHVTEGGWLTAEYALLPGSTHTRARRERKSTSGRTAEIQRLIGRSLRGVIDLSKLEGHSLTIDCDVLQADGGTRCAAITGGYIAAAIACTRHFDYTPPPVAAVSFGLLEGHLLTDLNYDEDSTVDVDFNIVLCEEGLVEVQGAAERGVYSPTQLTQMVQGAVEVSAQLFALQRDALGRALDELQN